VGAVGLGHLWSAVPDRPREKGKKLILKGSQKKKKKKKLSTT